MGEKKNARSATPPDEIETWRPHSGVTRVAQRFSAKPTLEIPAADAVPYMARPWDDAALHGLTREQIYFLTLLDGETPLSTLLDLSGAPPLEFENAIRHLSALGVIGFRARSE